MTWKIGQVATNNSKVIKILAELGIDVAPKQNSPEIQQLINRMKEYEKEMGHSLDPQKLLKYLR